VALLVIFAFVAGAGTALSPCVLPVLPAVLSASAAGGRRRPLGVVIGLAVTFTVTIAGLGAVVDGVGLGDNALRTIAAVVLLVFGLVLIVPRLGALVEAPLSRLARFGPRSRGDGFRSGLAVGAALGFAYAPCAGPILAAVITVGAAAGRTVPIAIAYSLGTACVLLLLALGGRGVARRIGHGPTVQRVLGVVMVLTALAIATDLDVRFQTALASHFPDAVVNPTNALERSHAVEKRLADLRGEAKFAPMAHKSGAKLPDYGPAPDFTDTQRWFNSRPLHLAQLRGKVVLIDFWTYTCINCLRTLPYVRAWAERYKRDGLVVVGVHTPEFSFEHDAANVGKAIKVNHLPYPVVQDNKYGTWQAWGNEAWPAKYLIDARGHVRFAHFGEGEYGTTESAIRSLLAEAGARRLGGGVRVAKGEIADASDTPETYIGAARAERFQVKPHPGNDSYPGVSGRLHANQFALGGEWTVDDERAEAASAATLDAQVSGRSVYLVMSSRDGRPRTVDVALDGRPVAAAQAGADVHAGRVTVRGQRLYRLVALPRSGVHRLTLRFEPGVSGYAFTFG
jgi:cytochrome c biogenesis protein CcdA/thiol-disulfide isomerase/thioredoxin